MYYFVSQRPRTHVVGLSLGDNLSMRPHLLASLILRLWLFLDDRTSLFKHLFQVWVVAIVSENLSFKRQGIGDALLAGWSLCGLDGRGVSGLIQYGILATYLVDLTLARFHGALFSCCASHDCFDFCLLVFEVGMGRKMVKLMKEEEMKGEEKERRINREGWETG